MNRLFLYFAGLVGLLPLILDSALKGFALLLVAAFVAMALYKSSAATRHLVWVVAVLTLLIVPLLSLALPQWRILPAWTAAAVSVDPVTPSYAPPSEPAGQEAPHMTTSESLVVPAEVGAVPTVVSNEVWPSVSAPEQPAGVSLESIETSGPDVVPGRVSFGWISFLWLAGFALLLLRLLAAHLFLRISARGCSKDIDTSIMGAFAAAREELGVRQRIRMLFDSRRTIPVVWGVIRPRLILPTEAREWDGEKLHSVLLHELAHIKRRDPLVQWLGQVACALHWWNPLVWLAAWRLHVERERACDDLVLSSGVRASAYAEHLLDVASKLSPARWTSACGLAMARKSSLEGRLRAVLSSGLKRGRVSVMLGIVGLLVGVAIAVPVAMLGAADGDVEEWNPPHGAHVGSNDFSAFCVHDGDEAAFVVAYRGDFNSSSSSGSNAKTRTWTNAVRLELKGADGGKVEVSLRREHTAPGTLSVGGVDFELEKGRLFLLDEKGGVRQVNLEVPVVRDQEAAKELADAILEWEKWGGGVRDGEPLPEGFEEAAWGEADESGLRAAWSLAPWKREVPLGTVFKSRVLFHNVGKRTVVFETEAWHQEDRHSARDAEGKKVGISYFRSTGITPLETYRLEPGHYCMVEGHGIAVGAGEYEEEHSRGMVGAVIDAEVGDEIRFSSLVDATGNGKAMFSMKLPTGEFTIRVGEVDPEAEARVRTATRSGRYVLSDRVRLQVGQVTKDGERRNSATVLVLDGEEERVGYEMALPNTLPFVFVWKRGSGELKLLTPEAVRMFDYSDPAKVEVADLGPEEIPDDDPIHYAMVDAYRKRAEELAGGWPLPSRMIPGASRKDEAAMAASKLFWGNVMVSSSPGEPFDPEELAALVKSVGDATWEDGGDKVHRLSWLIGRAGAAKAERFRYLLKEPALKEVEDPSGSLGLALAGYDYAVNGNEEALQVVVDALGKEEPGADAQALLPLALIDEWDVTIAAYEKHFSKGTDGTGGVARDYFWYKRQCLFPEAFDRYQAKLREEEKGKEAEEIVVAPRPKDPVAEMLYEKWKMLGRVDGKIPGALLGRLAAEMEAKGVKAGEVDGSRDWEQAEVVELLDALVAGGFDLRGIANRDVTFSEMRPIYHGWELPDALKDLKWGETAKCGLRVGWRMENSVAGLRRAELIFHNAGAETLYLRTQSWKKEEFPTARALGTGDFVSDEGTIYRVQSFMINWQINPGEYCKMSGNRIRIGAGEHANDFAVALVSALKKAEVKEEVSFWHSKGAAREGGLSIAERVANEGPVPESPHDRGYMVTRLMQELIGQNASAEEWASVAEDESEDALGKLVGLLEEKREVMEMVGELSKGELNFEISTAEEEKEVKWKADLGPQVYSDGKGVVRGGQPLPQMLESAAWGEPAESGLRAAWLLEPRGFTVPVGSVMKSRVLFHNAGKSTVVFQTELFHERDPHSARDAEGKGIRMRRTTHMGTRLRQLVTYRLKPGEYCEVGGYGIAVGAGEYEGEFSSMSIDSVIEAEVGDRVKFSSVVNAGDYGLGEDPVGFWNDIVEAMVVRETPMLETEKDRERLIRRVSEELFGSDPTGEEIEAFAKDKTPESLGRLTKRFQRREGIEVFVGNLPTGEFTFRVVEPDPEAAHRVRTATKMGRYTLGEKWRLDVRHHIEDGERRRFAKVLSLEGEAERVLGEIALPGYAAYAFAWKREAGEFFLLTAEEARRFVLKDGGGVEASDWELEEIEFGDLHMRLVNAYNVAAVEIAGGWPLPARLLPRRGTAACEIYWSSVIEADGCDYNPGERFDPEELTELAKDVEVGEDGPAGFDARMRERNRRLSWLISRAGAERDGRFRNLLKNEKLKEDEGVALALLGYDFAMNGNREALQEILDSLGKQRPGADAQELVTLAFIDEWDVTIAVYEKHFSKGTDGAGGLAASLFWLERQCLFPEAFDRHRSKKKDGAVTVPTRPGDTFAQMLFEKWRTLARSDGKIPGGLLWGLQEELKNALRLNPSHEKRAEITEVLSRIFRARDWEPAEMVELLDEVAGIPFGLEAVARRPVTYSEMRRTYPGRPLPDQFKDLKWGETAKCGLRVAWLMENQLGGLRRARLIFHNTGGRPLYLQTQGWKREEFPTARALRRGDFVSDDGAIYRSQSAMINWRLGPGEYCEAGGFRVTIGAGDNADDYAVALTSALEKAEIKERVSFWDSKGAGAEGKLGMTLRVAYEGPTPHSAEERELLIRRVMLDVYGTEPSEEEIANLVARPKIDWLGNLQFLLKQKKGKLFFVGGLSANQLNFEISPPEGESEEGPEGAREEE